MGAIEITSWQTEPAAYTDLKDWLLRRADEPYRFQAKDDAGPLVLLCPPATYHSLREMAPVWCDSGDQTEFALGEIARIAEQHHAVMINGTRTIDLSASPPGAETQSPQAN